MIFMYFEKHLHVWTILATTCWTRNLQSRIPDFKIQRNMTENPCIPNWFGIKPQVYKMLADLAPAQDQRPLNLKTFHWSSRDDSRALLRLEQRRPQRDVASPNRNLKSLRPDLKRRFPNESVTPSLSLPRPFLEDLGKSGDVSNMKPDSRRRTLSLRPWTVFLQHQERGWALRISWRRSPMRTPSTSRLAVPR